MRATKKPWFALSICGGTTPRPRSPCTQINDPNKMPITKRPALNRSCNTSAARSCPDVLPPQGPAPSETGHAAFDSRATVMLETAERLVVEDKEPALQQFLLLVGALRTMSEGERTPSQVLDSFLLRSLSVAGYAPTFETCARCGLEGPHRSFSPAAGGMLYATCHVPGSASPAPQTVELLGALLAGNWPAVEASEPRHRKEANGLVAAYLAWHMERGLKSLSHLER